MSVLLYYLIIRPLSILPYGLLYLLSDGFYLLIYNILGYRRKVVLQNLRNSFPGLNDREIKSIERKFYHHLCDLIIESLKNFHVNARSASKRYKLLNPDLLDKYYRENRSVALIGGHLGNWEGYALSLPIYFKHYPLGIYTPLNNKFLDKKVKRSRSRFGTEMIDKSLFKERMEQLEGTKPLLPVFVGDQAPFNVKRAHWMEFLHQDTPVFKGTERYARRYNMPVVYFEIQKVKRGYYEAELKVVTENPLETADGEITEKHTRLLEESIRKQPGIWLWSHRRWKRKRPEA